MPFYMRRKKVNGNERVDFVDEIGDKWQEVPVLHEKFKEWYLYNLEVQKERIEREFNIELILTFNIIASSYNV